VDKDGLQTRRLLPPCFSLMPSRLGSDGSLRWDEEHGDASMSTTLTKCSSDCAYSPILPISREHRHRINGAYGATNQSPSVSWWPEAKTCCCVEQCSRVDCSVIVLPSEAPWLGRLGRWSPNRLEGGLSLVGVVSTAVCGCASRQGGPKWVVL
jgi:hypothetical protein